MKLPDIYTRNSSIHLRKLVAHCFNGVKAIIRPRSAFKHLPDETGIPRRSVVAILGLAGFIFAFLHFGIAQQRLLLQYPLTDLVYIIFMPLLSIWIGIAGSLFFYTLARLFKQQVSFKKIEVAMLYMWTVWFIMPFFDIPHLFFDLNFIYILGQGAHLSWLLAFTYMPLFSFLILKDVIRLKKKQWLVAVLIALLVPFAGRYGVENAPLYLGIILSWINIPLGYEGSAFIIGPILFAGAIVPWIAVTRQVDWRPLMRRAVIGSTASMAILGITAFSTAQLLDGSRIPEMLGKKITGSSGVAVTEDRGNGYSYHTASHTWVSADYETATKTLTRNAAAGQSAAIATYSAVNFDFDPTQALIKEVRCKVNFTSATADYLNTDALPSAHCDILPNASGGTWYNGNTIGPLTTASGMQTWTWTDPTWAGQLRQTNNSVRVWGDVAANGNTNSPAGDTITYDAVTMEVHYVANVNQLTNRWYSNADSVQPGAAKAAENTPVSLIENNEVLRLRQSLRIATGRMDAGTENFRLQYATRNGGACGDDESWSDVGAVNSGAAWRMYNNPSVANSTIGASLLNSQTNVPQSYTESNPSPVNPSLMSGTSNTGEWDWAIQNYNGLPNTTYCFRTIENNGRTFAAYSNYPQATTANEMTLNQTAYRWFYDSNNLSAGSPLANQNSAAFAPSDGATVRLRMLLSVDGQTIPPGTSLKLQYAQVSGTCDPAFSGESYADVSNNSGVIRFRDNPSLTGGATAAANAGDPSYLSQARIYQQFVEANPFSSTAAAAAGQAVLWDFSLVDFSAEQGTQYCFRVVRDNGSLIAAYTQIPALTVTGQMGSDVVNAAGASISNPFVTMQTFPAHVNCQLTNGTLGSIDQKLRIYNGHPNSGWTISIAATGGPNALWSHNGVFYDYNDNSGSPAGCSAGLDNDTYGGQLSVNASSASVVPQAGCANTGITKGSPMSFRQGTMDSITLVSGTGAVPLYCYFDVSNISLSQRVPGGQPSGQYSLQLTITMVEM